MELLKQSGSAATRTTLPRLRFLNANKAIFNFDRVSGDWITGRQARHATCANVEARAVAGALDLVVTYLAVLQRPAVVGTEVGDGKELAVDVEDDDRLLSKA